ncbi:uncharacterized protein LOC141532648 [Cotesia typhae]|uniref:uncharacterized protein LOC141532648 n=1 Tax=Cotesia typhae TaxID=2053667 RepID=UPI003D6895CA
MMLKQHITCLTIVLVKKLLARGKLNVRYHHFREILLSSGATQNRKGKKRKAVDESVAVRIGIADEIFPFDGAAESCEDQLAWLKENLDPWATVDKFWRETSAARFQNLVLNKNFSSTDYINSIPALTHVKHGLKLIDIDFGEIYPHKIANLINNYDNLEKHLLQYCSKKQRVSKDVKILVSQWNECKDKDKDIRSAITFRLLVLLLPNPSTITSPNGSWYPRKDEVQHYFLLHAKLMSAPNHFTVAVLSPLLRHSGLTLN